MTIRKYKNSDIDSLMNIWLETNIASHAFINKDYWVSNYEAVKSMLPNAEILVYEEGNTIKGFAGIADDVFIAGIFVLEKYQRLGIGGKLIEECKRTHDKLELSVYIKNQKAIDFYKRNDFQIKREEVDGETLEKEYIMQWNLNK